MKTINISGVPEHFNLPWHLCIADNTFAKAAINLVWKDVPQGTGKLCEMLRNGSTDVAVILTEGIIKDINLGNKSKIVQIYVESPLIWGVHVDYNSNYFNLNDLKNKTAAISRFGSGSQLMSIVMGQSLGWDLSKMDFKIVNTIDGAVLALQNKEADYFLWEKFMTKPLVDAKVFRKIGDCPTPWPCFVIAVREDFLNKYKILIKKMLEIINNKTQNFKEIANIDNILAQKYNLKLKDVQQWLQLTTWSNKNIDIEMLNEIQNQLFSVEIIDKKSTFTEIVADL